MKRKFGSYKELLEQQQKLKALLEAKKDLIRSDVELLKIATRPVSDLFGKLSDPERKRRLLATGLRFAAKTVFKKIILIRASRLVRLVAPYLPENSRFDLKTLMSRFKNRISSLLKKIERKLMTSAHISESRAISFSPKAQSDDKNKEDRKRHR